MNFFGAPTRREERPPPSLTCLNPQAKTSASNSSSAKPKVVKRKLTPEEQEKLRREEEAKRLKANRDFSDLLSGGASAKSQPQRAAPSKSTTAPAPLSRSATPKAVKPSKEPLIPCARCDGKGCSKCSRAAERVQPPAKAASSAPGAPRPAKAPAAAPAARGTAPGRPPSEPSGRAQAQRANGAAAPPA
eukprot:CAMPEP_0177608138 /NCGR_PEP_ID=MMETSP0419_2-20121207/18304_1 /TAXON_ID=582737 /ORGANISM="Tetraselmis sp., Strain GSL018" /LENGTH=188 /DNA_ID=CAMNT_0019102793 /DNA_START=310 /DNA_END=872 /DNA_ORIENTATION=+